MLNFSTIHAMIQPIFIEPSLDFQLSQNVWFDVLYAKDDLHDDIPMPPMINDNAICALKSNTYAKYKYVIHNASDIDELQLLSSLNTLGYIEFDVLCNLSDLEEKLFVYADLPWFSRHTYYVIGKYNNKGEYMVHRVYICSNLNSPFTVQQCDQVEGCNATNPIMSSSSSFILKKQVHCKEGEQY